MADNNVPSNDNLSENNKVESEVSGKYVRELLREKQSLDSSQVPNALRLLEEEINKEVALIQTGGKSLPKDIKYIDVIREKPIRVAAKVIIPVKQYPNFNFIGKLLGPKGESMRKLQEQTMTKMSIRGRGSMRDKNKEEELRSSLDPKYSHLSDDLHVEILAFAPPAEAYAAIAFALAEIRKYLVPDAHDQIRQEQMREMMAMQGNTRNVGANGAPNLASAHPRAASTGYRNEALPYADRRSVPAQVPASAEQTQYGLLPPPLPPTLPSRTAAPIVKKVVARPPPSSAPGVSPAMAKVFSFFDRSRGPPPPPAQSYGIEQSAYLDADAEYIEYETQVESTGHNPEAFNQKSDKRWSGVRTPAATGAAVDRSRFRPSPYPRVPNEVLTEMISCPVCRSIISIIYEVR